MVRRPLQSFVAVLLVVLVPKVANAEWQMRPFGGITFGGSSPFVDLDLVQGKAKLNLGASALWQGEVLGIEGEVATTSGFFSGPTKRIARSHVATFGGNLVVALPRRMAEYSLRPYAVAGLGLAQVSFSDGVRSVVFSDVLPTWDVGGGATGFISKNVGLNWDVRRFRTLRSQPVTGQVVEEGKLSFWRATMGFAIRP